MTVIIEYILVASVTLIIEHLIKYSIDRHRVRKIAKLNEIPDRRLWDHKSKPKSKKSC